MEKRSREAMQQANIMEKRSREAMQQANIIKIQILLT